MHSFDAPSGTTFHHNGDFSGDVSFTAKIAETDDYDSDEGVVVASFADLKALVAEYVRRERIRWIEQNETGNSVEGDHDAIVKLEQMTDDEVLGLE